MTPGDNDPLGILPKKQAVQNDPLGILSPKKEQLTDTKDYPQISQNKGQYLKPGTKIVGIGTGDDRPLKDRQQTTDKKTVRQHYDISPEQQRQEQEGYSTQSILGAFNSKLGDVTESLTNLMKLGGDKGAMSLPVSGGEWLTNWLKSGEKEHPLPSTIPGQIVGGIAKTIPTALGAYATGGGSLEPEAVGLTGQYLTNSEIVQNGLKQAINPITKYMMGEQGLEEAGKKAKETGKLLPTIIGGVQGINKGFEEGTMLSGSMGAGEWGGKKLFDLAKKIGVANEDGVITEQALKSLIGTPTSFAASSVASDLAHGREVDWKNAGIQGLSALPFEASHITKAIGDAKDLNEKKAVIDKAVENQTNNKIANFASATPEDIQRVMNMPESADELQIKALGKGVDAQKAETYKEKNDHHLQQLQLQQDADIKAMVGQSLQDKRGLVDAVNSSNLGEQQKQDLINKINDVSVNYDPVEKQKVELGKQAEQNLGKIKEIDETEPTDYVHTLELRQQKANLEEENKQIDKQLTDLIKQQHENKNEGRQSGLRAETENEASGEQTIGGQERAVQQDGNDVEKGLTKTGESQTTDEPVFNPSAEPSVPELKGKEFTTEPISPQEYLKEAVKYNDDPLKPDDVESVKDAMRKGEPIDPVTLTYDKEGNLIGQNGKHRAQAAIDLGIKEIPVVKIKGELPDAIKEGNKSENREQEHKGTAQRENLPENGGEIRKEESQQTGGSNRPIGETEVPTGPERDRSPESQDEAQGERVKRTSIKKVFTEATRQEKQLPDVELSKFKGDSPTLERGKKLVGTGEVKPDEVINRVISGKGIYTPDEAAAMQYHMHQLRQAETDLRTQLDDINKKLESVPNEEQHKKTKDVILGNLRQLDDRMEEATRANRINSRSWSNLGNTMQIEADDTFSPANIRGIIRDNYGGEIPKDVQARLDAAIKERDQALSDLKKATEQATDKQGKQVVEKIRKSVKLVKQTKSELETEAEQLKQELRKALKADFSRINSGIPIPTETLAALGKLAVNYFKQGIKDFEGLVNKIHEDLANTGIDKQQVREYLSNYEPLRDESKSRRLELLARKERSLEKQLETGNIRDYSRKPEITFKKDNDVIRAEQRVKDAEFKIKQEKQKSYNKTKSGTQRGLDWLIRWERRFVLSSPAILEKLGAAVTIGGGFKRLPEEVIGGMWTKMLPSLMSKAPIEGGFNAKAEAEYWKEFSNPKKFFHNSIEILKTGASDLTKEFSDKPHEHYRYFDALTDLHPIIKDVSKRATYEASLIKGLNWAEGQGLDISDPLIRQNIKQMAYNRAEYEIFQENSGWNRRLQKFLNDERTPKNNKEMLTRFVTRFLMPVSTVPLNIARRIGNYATGLPRGLANAAEAYKAGIENLTNEQAEIIAKQLKQGTMGAALFSMGLFGIGGAYGGFYNKDDRGGLSRSGVFDPGFDEMYFGKQKVRKPIQHALPLQLIQLGATMRDVHKLYMDKYATSEEYNTELDKQMKSVSQAAMVSAAAIAEQVPMIEEPFELVGAFKDPYMRKKFGESMKRRVTPSIVNVFKK